MSDDIKVTVVKFSNRSNLFLRYIDPITKKQVHKSAETSSRKDAIKSAGRWEAELREGVVVSTRTSWAIFRKRYEDEVLTGLAAATDEKAQGVFNAVEKHLAPAQLRGITAERISYLQSKWREAGLSESTIKSNLSHLMAALRWAASVGMLATVPKVKMPKRAKGTAMKGRPIAGEEFDRMLTAVQKVVLPEAVASWQHYLRGLWCSGLRLAESLELSWDDKTKLCVDMQPGELPMLKIPAGLEKGHRDRLLPMAPEFAEFLAETPEHERTGFVFNPRARYVKRSARLAADFTGRVVAKFGEKAGVIVKPGATPKLPVPTTYAGRSGFAGLPG